jgi:hypothetical protein
VVDLRPYDRELRLEVIDDDLGAWGHLLLEAATIVQVEPGANETAHASRTGAER